MAKFNRKQVRHNILKDIASGRQQYWLNVMGRAARGNKQALKRLRKKGLLEGKAQDEAGGKKGGSGDTYTTGGYVPSPIKASDIKGPKKVGPNTYLDTITGLRVTTVAPPNFGGNPYKGATATPSNKPNKPKKPKKPKDKNKPNKNKPKFTSAGLRAVPANPYAQSAQGGVAAATASLRAQAVKVPRIQRQRRRRRRGYG